MNLYYRESYGKYREFDDKKDKFPRLPKGVIPVYILERKHYTTVWGFNNDRKYMFEWDRLSSLYNTVNWKERI